MSIFIIYSIILVEMNLIAVCFLRMTALAFFYNNLSRFFGSGFFTTLGLTLGLLALTCFAAYFIARPFDLIVKKIKNENYIPTEEEKIKCLRCYKLLNRATIAVSFVGFFVGQFAQILIGVYRGLYDFETTRVTLILLHALSFGIASCVSSVLLLDVLLEKFRKLLKIHTLEGYEKARSAKLSTTIILTSLSCMYILAINLIAVTWGTIHLGPDFHPAKKIFLALFVSIWISACLIIWLIILITKRISKVALAMDKITKKGDLTRRISISTLDDFGDLATSINKTMDKVSSMINQLNSKTNEVYTAANLITDSVASAGSTLNQMSGTLAKINDNSTKQNSLVLEADKNILSLVESVENVKKQVAEETLAVENISSSVTEMTASIATVTSTAKKAQETSDLLTQTSAQGQQSITNAVSTMKEIKEYSDQVTQIVKAIQSLAQQTNLLSMNAAIEAAHAGQFGAGFAVVADEVRNLAESSANSAKEIQEQISLMTEKIDAGVDAINSAGNSFNEVAEKVGQNAQLVNQISSAMEEQNAGAEETQASTIQVVNAVKTVDSLTQSGADAAQKLRDFMSVVVDASDSTMTAVEESFAATENLKNSISDVNKSANENKTSVDEIKREFEQFKL